MSSTAPYQTARTTTSPASGSPTWPARTSPDSSAASASAFAVSVPSRVTEWLPASARVAMPRPMLPVPIMVMSMRTGLSGASVARPPRATSRSSASHSLRRSRSTVPGSLLDTATAARDDPRAPATGAGHGGKRFICMVAHRQRPDRTCLHPDRVRALVVFNGFARMFRDDNYPIGIPQRFVEQFRDAVTDTNPDPSARRVDDLALQAPSLAGDARFRAWWQRAGEESASPGVSRSQFQLILAAELRAVLPEIRVPTLVVRRRSSTCRIRSA